LQGVKDPRGPVGMTASPTAKISVYPATHLGPDQVNVFIYVSPNDIKPNDKGMKMKT
jgi:hypothetical protein